MSRLEESLMEYKTCGEDRQAQQLIRELWLWAWHFSERVILEAREIAILLGSRLLIQKYSNTTLSPTSGHAEEKPLFQWSSEKPEQMQ